MRFRPLREKCVLSEEDKKARYALAKKYKDKPASWFLKSMHASIDCKHFTVYGNEQGRAYAAQRAVRGAFRTKGQGFSRGFVKPSKTLKQNFGGGRSIMVCAGVGGGRMLLWHEVKEAPGGRRSLWNGAEAAAVYKGPLLRGLQKAFPKKRKYLVLEDNDPAGFKSSKGVQAKDDAGISSFCLAPRSPDRNPLDYAIWAGINKKMREADRYVAIDVFVFYLPVSGVTLRAEAGDLSLCVPGLMQLM